MVQNKRDCFKGRSAITLTPFLKTTTAVLIQNRDGSKGASVVTPGSNGAARSPLGSPSNSSQRQGPSLADVG